ncbi:MAG: YceI family protein [Bacteroidota bacterium]|nr:YceI family protein [Bacteroidota bacterium]
MKLVKILAIITLITACSNEANSQVYFTKNGGISFFSKASLEYIQADNNQVISIINIQSGEIRFSVLNNAFHFPKAMMEEHFNSDYMESEKFPASTFKGTITGINKVDVSKNAVYSLTVQGDLSIHGISKPVTTTAMLNVNDGKIEGNAVFKILLKDFDIKIPSLVINNISEKIEIRVKCIYEKK